MNVEPLRQRLLTLKPQADERTLTHINEDLEQLGELETRAEKLRARLAEKCESLLKFEGGIGKLEKNLESVEKRVKDLKESQPRQASQLTDVVHKEIPVSGEILHICFRKIVFCFWK